jgi:ParB family chromosome partitioning protein
MVYLDQIEVKGQLRQEFEDDENSLAELAESIKARGVLQPILLRPNPNSRGSAAYELVAGERRYRASLMAELEQIPAYIKELTDEEAEDAQYAENVQRKNLTQIEEAKKLQRDLDRLGSTDAVLQKHNKSRAWLSKMLNLLYLPENTRRLVTENISADVEVINAVKGIEKKNPVEAKALVDELKNTPRQGNAREKVAEVKDRIKPKLKAIPAPASRNMPDVFAEAKSKMAEEMASLGHVGKPELKPNNEPQNGTIEQATTKGEEGTQQEAAQVNQGIQPTSDSPKSVLKTAYRRICDDGETPQQVLGSLADEDRDNASHWLKNHYDAGRQSANLATDVLDGLREGVFDTTGEGAFAMIAYLHGASSGISFNLLDILGGTKKQ